MSERSTIAVYSGGQTGEPKVTNVPYDPATRRAGFSTKPIRVQLRRRKGWRMPANTVSVARPSPYGNYSGPTKKDFDDWIASMSNADRAFFMGEVNKLQGKNLACWCRPDQECHADTLLVLANPEIGQ